VRPFFWSVMPGILAKCEIVNFPLVTSEIAPAQWLVNAIPATI
jgi:hypothetical protein